MEGEEAVSIDASAAGHHVGPLRPSPLFWIGLTALALGCSAGDEATDPPVRPNLLLIVVDTLRSDHLHAYGHERSTSPAIDVLAADATLFESAYSTAPWTKPAVASILTGLRPRSHTVVSMLRKLPESVESLAEILSAEGYATGAVVSHILVGESHRFHQGFEIFHEDEAHGHRHLSTDGVTRRALEVLEKMTSGDRPFFLFVHYFDPHYDYMPHPEYGWAPRRAGRLTAGESKTRAAQLEPAPTQEEIAFIEDLYDEEIRFTDEGIGTLLDQLRERDIYDETVIALTADHGEEFFERGCIGHTRTLYDELVRVPLLVRESRRRGGASRVDAPVSLAALAPTLLELVGIDLGARHFDAESIARLVRGSEDPGDRVRTVFTEVNFKPGRSSENGCPPTRAHLRAVIRGPYKLIDDRLSDRLELFDLEIDPGERNDLSNERPELRAMLKRVLAEDIQEGRHKSEERQLTPEEVEQLRNLGYIER